MKRQKTKIAQKLPAELDEKVISFQRYVIKKRVEHQYALANIGNMDEMPMNFDMPPNRTVNSKGSKTVLIKTTGHEKTRFTVVLACMAHGTKLKPMVVFKRKTMPKLKFPAGVVVHVHPKGWMDEDRVKLWTGKVWKKRPGGLMKTKSLLVWDMFKAHVTEKSKDYVKRMNIDLAVIPGGLTSVVQPLDVCLNKPFKDLICQYWSAWIIDGEKTFTKGGNMRAPPLDLLCEWVVRAWAAIDAKIVGKFFSEVRHFEFVGRRGGRLVMERYGCRGRYC